MNRFYTGLLFIMVLSISSNTNVWGQRPQRMTSSEIHNALQKLNVLGSALYVAAHPDDENTRMIAYLANEQKMNVAYLSLTRGDGGQNLVGPEIREQLGVIRTHELLAARRTDGGQQMFSRANDFGYSKHPDETLNIWNKKEVLSDMIWAIRKWQPDIIINRFDHQRAGRTHGHHTTSAILSYEAFDLVGKEDVHPEQLEYVDPWQPRRLFHNTSWWFFGGRDSFAKADKSKFLAVDVGVYFPKLGKSNTEIAAESRSMHKSQGFGSTGSRGREMEYLKLLKGDMPKDKENMLEGINMSWTRVDGGAAIGLLLKEVEAEFNFDQPHLSIPKLLKAYRMINGLKDGYWKHVKLKEIKNIIQACMGLFIEAVADDYSATPGQTIELDLEVINRSPINASLKSFHLLPDGLDTTINKALEFNELVSFSKPFTIPASLSYSSPYWLSENWELGMYTVKDQLLRGLPETPREVKVAVQLQIAGTPMEFVVDVVYKRNDPVKGETYRPFEVIPPVSANILDNVYLFASDAPKVARVKVKSGVANLNGEVMLDVPDGWEVQPAKIPIELALKGLEKTVEFQLFPPSDQHVGTIYAKVKVGDHTYDQALSSVEYDHIPTQTILFKSQAKAVKVNLKKAGQLIGYIPGAGDAIPECLEQVGFEVVTLDDNEINTENLAQYDAVILGIRAYNTNERMKFHNPILHEYVKRGGTVISQYNTTRSLKLPSDQLGPYPFKLSRDRTSVEEAPIRILLPDHPALNFPNKITDADFEDWVQERGLYFANEWDEKYDALLSSNDPGEKPHDGGLLIGKYGEGYYVYSGYSWFRELPAGVPGAYRLFVNLIALGNKEKP